MRSKRTDVPITLYRLSGFSATCLFAQVVLPLAGKPINMIISHSSLFSVLQLKNQIENVLQKNPLVHWIIKG